MNSTPKKLLYFCSSSVFGGAERFIETCLHGHREVGDFEAAAFFLNSGDFSKYCEEQEFKLYYSPISVRLKNIFSWLVFQFYFYLFLKKEKIDIVHLTMPYSQLFASLPARLAGVKIIWFQHGPVGGTLDKLANKLPYDHLFFNSIFTKEEHLKTVGRIKASDHIINMKVRTNFDSNNVIKIREKYKTADKLFICTGRICRWKGFEHAIKVVNRLNKDAKIKATLLIAGKPSNEDDKLYYQSLIDLVTKLNLSESVKFLGFKSNVYDYVKASDALLHTSTTPEPFGLVIAEAISLNTFVFVTNLGGAAEQISLNPDKGMSYESSDLSNSLYLAILKKYKDHINDGKIYPPESLDCSSQVIEMLAFIKKTVS
jgi:glycosyltransferase involved in cell wall biosynthesis